MPFFQPMIVKSKVLPGPERVHVSTLVDENGLLERPHPDVKTFYDVMQRGRTLAKDAPCLGYRPGPEEPYVWITYDQAFEEATAVASALVELGLEAGNNTMVGIYGINSPEWMLTHFATVANSMISVPLYHTYDSDSLKHILKQTELRAVFCDTEQRLMAMLDLCRKAKTDPGRASSGGSIRVQVFVLMKREAKFSAKSKIAFEREPGVRFMTFDDLLTLGSTRPSPFRHPAPDDVYMICYTSGTTGNPKGVVLTHRNMVAGLASIVKYIEMSINLNTQDRLISFLPLAHIYEQVMEAAMFYSGASVGYYRGDILKLVEDAQALKPTIFPIVPRLLNRLVDRIKKSVAEGGRLKQRVFEFALKRKQALIEQGYWGGDTIWDKTVFRKVHAILGGRVRFMCTGSAPISPEVMKFARAVFGAVLLEGYGQTECAAAGSITLPGDASVGHVGVPAPCCQIKLVDVPDVGYCAATDRGEVCIRGPNVMREYYKQPDKTADTLDSEGWLHTGDIGRWTHDGCLQIIDRKRHIFKLAQGEWVAPEKIENVYAKCPLISQLFVDGSGLQSYLVAVVVPDEEEVRKWIRTQPLADEDSDPDFEAICARDTVRARILAQMQETGKRGGLSGLEQVKAVYLCPEAFTPENGLATPTMKNRRPQLRKRFLEVIDRMYKETNEKMM